MDGTELVLKPLSVSLLRKFMKTFDKIAKVADDNDKSMDVLLDCVQIALKQYVPELSEKRKELEDLIDLPTVYKVIDAASGMQLSDTTGLISTTK